LGGDANLGSLDPIGINKLTDAEGNNWHDMFSCSKISGDFGTLLQLLLFYIVTSLVYRHVPTWYSLVGNSTVILEPLVDKYPVGSRSFDSMQVQ